MHVANEIFESHQLIVIDETDIGFIPLKRSWRLHWRKQMADSQNSLDTYNIILFKAGAQDSCILLARIFIPVSICSGLWLLMLRRR